MEDTKIVMRQAETKDGATLLFLIDALADYEHLPKPDAAARARLLEDGFGKRRRFETLLAEVDGKAAGYAIFFETYSSFLALPTLYLEDIFVLKEFRQMKIGYRLFMECAGEAFRRGCGRMDWAVLDWNQLAIGFYEKLGAKQLKEWLPYRLVREDMEKLLGKSVISGQWSVTSSM